MKSDFVINIWDINFSPGEPLSRNVIGALDKPSNKAII